MAIYRVDGKVPEIASTAFVATNATVVGQVSLGDRSSVWFNAVVRGDNASIRVGAGTNIQDAAVLHGSPGCSLNIGDRVTVGHGAKLHGCTVGDCALIGIDAIVLDNAVIGCDSKVAAGSVVLAGMQFPPGSLIAGAPAQLKRALRPEEIADLRDHAERYVRDARNYLETLERIDRAEDR